MVHFLLAIIEFFASSYSSNVVSRYWLMSAFFDGRGVGHFKHKFQVEADIAHQPVGMRKL